MRSSACMLAFLLLGWTACSEPGKRVTQSTGDGAFELTLKASKGWVRPDEVLAIRVTLVSLNGPLEEGLDEEIEFLVNNGFLDDDELDATLPPGETTFSAWISFEADRVTTESQGEVHALFRDVLATLKLRIVAAPD